MEQELEYTDTNSTDYIDLNTDSDGDEIGDSIADWATIKIQPELVDEDEKQLSKSRYGHSRTIIHLDIDCFYAQVEMAKNESLRNKPLGIRQKHIIVTCNYPARELGVGKLVTLKKALEKCPNLVVIAGEDLTEYRQVSFKVTDYLKNFSSKVHRLGFDENYVDVTEQIELKLKQMQGINLHNLKIYC